MKTIRITIEIEVDYTCSDERMSNQIKKDMIEPIEDIDGYEGLNFIEVKLLEN